MIQPVIDSGIIHIFKGKQTIPIKLVIGEILAAEIMDIFPTGNIQIKINNRIINAQPQRDLPLQRGDIVYVKVEKPLSDGTIPLRILSTETQQQFSAETLEVFQIIKDIPSEIFKFINTLFASQRNQQGIENKNLVPLQMDETTYVNLVKTFLTSPVEKIPESERALLLEKLMEVFSNSSSTAELINELVSLLEKEQPFKEMLQQLKKILILDTLSATSERFKFDSSNALNRFADTPENLKKVFLISGVAFEAKLKKNIAEAVKPEDIREDLKTILSSIIREAKSRGIETVADKAQQVLRQIEGYQILSKTYQSFFTFLPVLWKDIKGGSFAFKSFKRQGKDYYTAFVSLKIKDEESLSFVVTMIKKSFFISFSGNSEILQLIRNYEDQLKERFHQVGMVLVGINYFTKLQELIKHWSIKEGLVSVTV